MSLNVSFLQTYLLLLLIAGTCCSLQKELWLYWGSATSERAFSSEELISLMLQSKHSVKKRWVGLLRWSHIGGMSCPQEWAHTESFNLWSEGKSTAVSVHVQLYMLGSLWIFSEDCVSCVLAFAKPTSLMHVFTWLAVENSLHFWWSIKSCWSHANPLRCCLDWSNTHQEPDGPEVMVLHSWSSCSIRCFQVKHW